MEAALRYYVFYKPYNVLNQFSKERPGHTTLADYLKVDKDVYPVGRLDKDSEGLLILTNDKRLNSLILHPVQKHRRSYFVQLDNDIPEPLVQKVSQGVDIKLDSGIYHTLPCKVKKMDKPPLLAERNPPVRYRQHIPTSWVLIELTEGKNRQVRKMFASVGFPVLRLVRVQMEDLKLGKLNPGQYIELSQDEIFSLLNIKPDQSKKSKEKPPIFKKNSPDKSSHSKEKSLVSGQKKKTGRAPWQNSNKPKKKSP